ncbi:uncharacterized protein LOC143297930 isoform X2 [Babylonia areolata]|uniref:uncharacterized protein LOC143297930 isoform X2 n=1 Tax=Babylonia areolata TaxID=304850 RepID=UPI003FD34122
MLLTLLMVVVEVMVGEVVAAPVPAMQAPNVSIVVHVRRRQEHFWEPWQLNSNVCPHYLCTPLNMPNREEAGGGVTPLPPTYKPRGTGATAQRVILRAFKHITQRSCITFRKKNGSDADYVRFISDHGCWSLIGRKGGKQVVSVGRGCENIGTAVHEIFHSLGVWHEQARKDRDEFVEILEENISERFLKDFDKISEHVSTSRGFPYDYGSVMHYSKFAFTRNGKPTIKVIGVGRELGLVLRQRHGLSTIDMAQLRDMYRCNLYSDSRDSSCPDDWLKHDASCYRFFDRPKLSFPAADRKCAQLNSHLVFIETQREDKFLAGYLWREFPSLLVWRTGGRVVNDTMKWHRRDSNPGDLGYSNWGRGEPSTRTSLVLERDHRTNVTLWVGVWTGSMRSRRDYVYPFVCERRARRRCLPLAHADGRDYRGTLDHTVDGHTCQKWTEHYPHPHNLTDRGANASPLQDEEDRHRVREDGEGLGDHNFCRNPRAMRRGRPWCFTTKRHPEWQLCDVSSCQSASSGSG